MRLAALIRLSRTPDQVALLACRKVHPTTPSSARTPDETSSDVEEFGSPCCCCGFSPNHPPLAAPGRQNKDASQDHTQTWAVTYPCCERRWPTRASVGHGGHALRKSHGGHPLRKREPLPAAPVFRRGPYANAVLESPKSHSDGRSYPASLLRVCSGGVCMGSLADGIPRFAQTRNSESPSWLFSAPFVSTQNFVTKSQKMRMFPIGSTCTNHYESTSAMLPHEVPSPSREGEPGKIGEQRLCSQARDRDLGRVPRCSRLSTITTS